MLGLGMGLKRSASRPPISSFLASRGLTGANAGGDLEGGTYWLPSGDSASSPRFASEAEFFAQFTRAGSKYITGANGLLTSVGVNALPWDWSSGARRLFLEGGATNLRQNSDTLSGISAPLGGVALTIGGSSDPKGSTSASRLVYSAGAYTVDYDQVVTGNIGGRTFTRSVWLRSDTPVTIALRIAGGAGYATDQTISIVSITTSWTRFSVTRSFNAGTATTNITLGLDNRSIQGANQLAKTIYVFGDQLEEASFASSYITTAGSAVSRAPDNNREPVAMESVLQRTAASVVVRGRLNRSGVDQPRILGCSGANAEMLLGASGNNGVVNSQNNSGSSLAATLGLSGLLTTGFGVAVAYDGSGRSLCGNGGTVATSANAATVTTPVYLGRNSAVGAGQQSGDGLYKLIAAYPSRLSNAALQALAVA